MPEAAHTRLLARLVELLSGFDDAALESLANRGLLRRAKKDLEREAPELLEQGDEALSFSVGAAHVTMPAAGPGAASCDCRAPGTCRHVLTVCLAIQQPAWRVNAIRGLALRGDAPSNLSEVQVAASRAEASESPNVADEVLAVGFDELVAFGDRALLREARELLDEVEVEVETLRDYAVVRFPELFAEVRYLRGTGLAGIVPPPREPRQRRLALAAMLALRRACGAPLAAAEALGSPEVLGAPRSRAEVIAEARSLFCSLVEVGLSHATDVAIERLTTLSTSAAGVKLPRLGRELSVAAAELRWLAKRHARADEQRLLAGLARGFALCEALAAAASTPPLSLAGVARSRYHEVGRLEVCGLGAYPWRTRTGYRGLTVLLWERRYQRWLSWSAARPEGLPGEASALYRSLGPWPGVLSPRQLSRGRFVLLGARKNGLGRLSGSQATRALAEGALHVDALALGERVCSDFAQLDALLAATRPRGLALPHPLAGLVVARPAAWGELSFDRVGQRLWGALVDGAGCSLALELGYGPDTSAAIAVLEGLDADELSAVWGVVGQLVERDRVAVLLPRSLLVAVGDGELSVLNLAFDDGAIDDGALDEGAIDEAGQREEGNQHRGDVARDDTGDDVEDDVAERGESQDPRCARLASALEQIAERGTAGFGVRQREALEDVAAALCDAGCELLGTSARRIVRVAVGERAAALLRARQLLELHAELR